MIEYILFDLDGTLTNPERGITNSVAYSLKFFGIDVDDKSELRKFIGPPLKQSYITFYNFDDEKADEAVAKYREYFAPKGLYENEVFDGIPELLQCLKDRGYRLAVATSKPTVYSEKICEHFNLSKYFDKIIGSELDGRRTNKAEVIQYAVDSLKINRENCIMIGDRLHDMIGSKQNGIKAIGVTFGFGSKQELIENGADYIAETVAEIGNIIKNIDRE